MIFAGCILLAVFALFVMVFFMVQYQPDDFNAMMTFFMGLAAIFGVVVGHFL